jgi:hypothetical protein
MRRLEGMAVKRARVLILANLLKLKNLDVITHDNVS